jgi:hypothetical protein
MPLIVSAVGFCRHIVFLRAALADTVSACRCLLRRLAATLAFSRRAVRHFTPLFLTFLRRRRRRRAPNAAAAGHFISFFAAALLSIARYVAAVFFTILLRRFSSAASFRFDFEICRHFRR